MLNAVLFDLDNTLIDREAAFRACVYDRFRNLNARAELLQLDDSGHGNREDFFAAWRQLGGGAIDQKDFGKLITERIKPDRELLRTLKSLSRMVKLGIITNGGSETQRSKLKAAGLTEVILPERIWVSEETHLAKPDPGMFLLASKVLGELVQDCFYIGNHETDFQGATAAGMPVCVVEQILNAERLMALLNPRFTRRNILPGVK